MRKTVMYMLLAAAVLGMGGCGKANQPASADNGGTEAKKQKQQLNSVCLPVLWPRIRLPVPV